MANSFASPTRRKEKKATTALVEHAKDFKNQKHDEELQAPMVFPMYTVAAETVLEMTKMRPHEELKADGLLTQFDKSMGRATFVSHQWVGRHHPDPDFKQFKVLQDALKNIMTKIDEIHLDIFSEIYLPDMKPMSTKEFRSTCSPIFVWYDFFSCPQLEAAPRINLLSAIDSIPAYVAQCEFFFVLCPCIEASDRTHLLSPNTWAERGWCRVERTMRELSTNPSYIVVKSATQLELVASAAWSYGGSVGEGMFAVSEDRDRLSPIFQAALKRRILECLKNQDLPGYRAQLNLQELQLRGLAAEPCFDFVPGGPGHYADCQEADAKSIAVKKFLYQNGFTHVNEDDEVGWSPLCYAAVLGDPMVVEGLLEQRANPCHMTGKAHNVLGVEPGRAVLGIASFFGQNEVLKLLLSAGAQFDGTIIKPVVGACFGQNAEGVKILCEARGSPYEQTEVGFNALELACNSGSLACVDAAFAQSECAMDIRGTLINAMWFRGGSAAMVAHLINIRADVNYQQGYRSQLHVRILQAQAAQYESGWRSIGAKQAYDWTRGTPLMVALHNGQYEGAAALIAAGARLDLENSRKRTAIDIARELQQHGRLPDFLEEAFQGNIAACRRIADNALQNSLENKLVAEML